MDGFTAEALQQGRAGSPADLCLSTERLFPMAFPTALLLHLLDLEQVGEGTYLGRSPAVGWPRVYGGMVVAQALVAASRTAPDRAPHALHAFFMRPGDPAEPISYGVTRLRDGRSFATRQCVASQRGAAIFTCTVSFQSAEAGLEHQIAMPDVPPPDDLPSEAALLDRFGDRLSPPVRRYLSQERPVELRPVDIGRLTAPPGTARAPVQNIWMRATGALPDDPAVHRAMLAYMSDMTLLDTALASHGRWLLDPAIQIASLDHALWLHRPAKADDWLLYAQDSPNGAGGRGLTRGSIFARDGRLIASTAQEGLMRLR